MEFRPFYPQKIFDRTIPKKILVKNFTSTLQVTQKRINLLKLKKVTFKKYFQAQINKPIPLGFDPSVFEIPMETDVESDLGINLFKRFGCFENR